MERLISNKVLLLLSMTAVLLFSAYALFYKLGNEPFQDYDEATYAEVTHESIADGNPTSLSFLHQPYFRKPPLLFWMTTVSESVFSDVEFADRFSSALAGLLAIILVALVCIEAGTGVPFALGAAAALATTAGWMEFARDVRFDNLVAFFALAAFYAGIRALRDSRWFLAVGAALAFAILSKSVMAVFGGVAVLAILIHGRRLPSAFSDRYFWFGIGIFFLIAAPWHIYMTLTYGAAFWHSYLGAEVLTRASTNLFPNGNNPTNGQYIGYLLSNAAPWFQLFVVTLVSTPLLLRRLRGTARTAFLGSVITALSVLVVVFVAKTKAFGYLIPLFPFMAVALGIAAREIWRGISLRPVVVGVAVVLFVYAGVLTRYEALHLDPYYGYELGTAREEQGVAAIIRAAQNPEVYTYGNYSDFGTILYYSRLPDTRNPYILYWSASSTPQTTGMSFIVGSTTLDTLRTQYPHYTFTQDYSGKFVSLFTVTD